MLPIIAAQITLIVGDDVMGHVPVLQSMLYQYKYPQIPPMTAPARYNQFRFNMSIALFIYLKL